MISLEKLHSIFGHRVDELRNFEGIRELNNSEKFYLGLEDSKNFSVAYPSQLEECANNPSGNNIWV